MLRRILLASGIVASLTLHRILGIATVLLFTVTVGFGAAAFGRRFRLYSVASIVIAFGFGMLTGFESPRLAANLPTPYIGLWERITIAVYMLWLVVLAVTLLRRRETGTVPAAGATRRNSLTGAAA